MEVVVACAKCKTETDDFTSGQLSRGISRICRSCVSIMHKNKRANRVAKIGDSAMAQLDWTHNLKTKFNMTPEQWLDLYDKQEGKCAVCKVEQCASGRKFAVDHDHRCCPTIGKCCGGCVRGLLCLLCNTLVGKIESNRERLNNVLEYIGWGEQS